MSLKAMLAIEKALRKAAKQAKNPAFLDQANRIKRARLKVVPLA